jgi:hypothetical protein
MCQTLLCMTHYNKETPAGGPTTEKAHYVKPLLRKKHIAGILLNRTGQLVLCELLCLDACAGISQTG